MEISLLGLTAAVTAFLSIWMGHVAVRKIEYLSPTIWLPTLIFLALGLTAETCSLTTTNRPLSTILGIFGITLLWDALEITRQQNRVRKGHAPANPRNPRHGKMMNAE
ncbi:MAG: hypothetical protein OHK0031_00530 [Anaerolineales bacterium]